LACLPGPFAKWKEKRRKDNIIAGDFALPHNIMAM
jgi:hypothetical protein